MKNKNKFGFGGYVDPISEYLNIKRQRASNIPNQIESPDQAIADNNIRLSRAQQKAMSNPLTQGLDIFGNIAMQVGSTMMSNGISAGEGANGKGIAGFLNKNQNFINTLLGGLNAGASFATGGVAGNKKINAEGGEVVETPDGLSQELVGPSHAEGGIDMTVPSGTEIYSDRLLGADGKTMAERKKAREKQISKIEKLLQKNPNDKALKKTLEKIKQNNDFLDKQDLSQMQFVKDLVDSVQNSNIGSTPKYAPGGIVPPWYDNLKNYYRTKEGDFDFRKVPSTNNNSLASLDYADTAIENILGDYNNLKEYQASYNKRRKQEGVEFTPLKENGIFGKNTLIALLYENAMNINAFDSTVPTPITITSKPMDVILPDTSFSITPEMDARIKNTPPPQINTTQVPSKGKGFSLDDYLGGTTFGDMLGMGANLFGPMAQMNNTLANRSATPVEQNWFKDYGKQALSKIQDQYGLLDDIRDNALLSLEKDRAGSISRNNASARSINTQRALNLATDAAINNNKSDLYSKFAQSMLGVKSQEAAQMDRNDQMRMFGEEKRAERELQNTDNFYSNLAKAISDKYKGIGETGKSLNKIKEREVTQKNIDKQLDLLKSVSDAELRQDSLEAAKLGIDILTYRVLKNSKSKKEK